MANNTNGALRTSVQTTLSLTTMFVAWFEQAYQANNKPTGMAMFSHNDSSGFTIGVSVTPQSVPYCPFSSEWSESATRPDYGHAGWVAGDV